MQVKSTFFALFTIVGLLLVVGMPMRAAASQQDENTRVVIVEDITSQSDCLEWVNSSENSQPCSAGSIVSTQESTLAEAKRRGSKHYVVLTHNAQKNDELKAGLVKELRDTTVSTSTQAATPNTQAVIVDGRIVTQAACTAGSPYVIGRSYLVEGVYVQYQVSYTRTNTCAAINVTDRMNAQQNNTRVWRHSRSSTTNQPIGSSRNQVLTTSWTASYILPNTGVGNTYENRTCVWGTAFETCVLSYSTFF